MKLFFIGILLLTTGFSSVHANEQEILRLQKGEYYYHYLTGDFPSAMNQLKLWRATDEAVADEADVMEATMLLSLGLQDQAQLIFAEIQQKGQKVSALSWFFLTRRLFELEQYESALSSLQNIESSKLTPELLLEAQFMKAASLIELGELKKALTTLSTMPRDSIWTGLVRHNLILAMFNSNSSGHSLTVLIEDATYYLPDTEEGRDLGDRIHLVAAINYLIMGKHRSAEKHLKRIRLNGPYTPIALLQYGWTKVEQGQYEEALQPWRELQTEYNHFNPEVMESMLGVPHVLELMYASTQALNVYETTETRLGVMKEQLMAMNNGLAANPWLEDWIYNQEDQGWGWQANIETTLPLNETTEVLQHLVSSKAIVNQMTDYRDLLLLSNYLDEKENSLKLWLTLVDKRELADKSRNTLPVLEQAGLQLRKVKDELIQMQAKLDSSEEDFFALPNDKEAASVDVLRRSVKVIEDLALVNKASRDVKMYQHRWERIKGVLLWQMNEEKPGKQWELKKQLVGMDTYLKIADRQLLETQLANQWSPSSWVGMNDKILAVLSKVKRLKASTEQAKLETKAILLAESKQYLTDQVARINDYLAQSRLSIARLYDEALQRQVAFSELNDEEQK